MEGRGADGASVQKWPIAAEQIYCFGNRCCTQHVGTPIVGDPKKIKYPPQHQHSGMLQSPTVGKGVAGTRSRQEIVRPVQSNCRSKICNLASPEYRIPQRRQPFRPMIPAPPSPIIHPGMAAGVQLSRTNHLHRAAPTPTPQHHPSLRMCLHGLDLQCFAAGEKSSRRQPLPSSGCRGRTSRSPCQRRKHL